MDIEEQPVREEGGISLREIFRTIWLRKWVALAVAVALFLVCSISIFYGYNPSKKIYVMEFSLNLPGDDNGVVYIYPNGSQLYYSEMTSLDTLKAIKKSNDSFADIDVEDIVARGGINIERNINVLVDDDSNQSAYKEITYTITAKASCFSSLSQAKAFLTEIANTPADYLSSMEINYGVYISLIEASQDYEEIIVFLKNQLSDIEKKYDELIETYGESFVVDPEGNTLLAYSQELKAYNSSNVLDNLLTEARTNFYIKNTNVNGEVTADEEENAKAKIAYTLKLTEIENELAKAKQTLEKLELIYKGSETGSTVVLDVSVLKAQYDLIYDLEYQKSIIEGYINEGTYDPDYDAKMQSAIDKVEELTASYSTTSATVYSNASSVVYVQPGIISTTGGFGLMTILFISLVVAVIIALIAGYVAGKLKLNALKRDETDGGEVVLKPSLDENGGDNK